MITVMRRYRRVLQVGLLVVIAAFVLTSVYVGSMSGGARNRGDVVATVNGEAIPVERYQRRYQAYLDAYSRVYRDRFSPTLAEQLGLPQQAVNDLVQEAVVVQRARAEGLEVGDEELNAQIQAVPAFAENGRFSLARYQDFLRRRGVSASAFENDYTEHAKDFETPRQVHAAHVLVVVPQTGGSEAEDKARAKVADVIRRAKAGEDFGKLAAELSEDPGSKPKGGDLGWISKGEMVPAFEAVAFTLGRGELTPEPVRTPFGFHAIKVLEVRPGGKRPLKDVAPQIRDRLAAEAADKAARAKADEVKPALQAAKDFVAEARRLGLTPVETTMSKVERIPMLGGSDPLEEAAFALAVGGVSSPVKTPAGWVVLKSSEAIAAGVPPLAEIRDKVMGVVKRQKAEAVALERAQKLAAAAATNDLTAAAKSAGAQTGETARFSRGKPTARLPGA